MRHTKLLAAACVLLAAGCASVGPAPENTTTLPPIRFLLTFDDGPSAALGNNPTERILDTLARNNVQPDIKAVFFVQTRWPGAGGSSVGQRLLRRMVADGHVLGIHSGTERGHINHRVMSQVELHQSLDNGRSDIHQIASKDSALVRPTFWAFDPSTLATYDRAGVSMLLTDIRARDGIFTWYQISPDGDWRMDRDFRHFLHKLASGRVQVVNGIAPVVVTFHDTSLFTAAQLSSYFAAMIDTARRAGIRVADPPFYRDHDELLSAAQARANNHATRADIAP